MKQGKVYLVGAGPGDPGLITVRGYQLIQEADVICYDHLICFELLDAAPENCEKISVGKFSSNHTMSQHDINALLIQKAHQGKTVIRLKGGDCYLFGRGGEEAQACAQADIEFEVVPGITSALAVPCYAGIPPTHRDYTAHIAIVTGHRKQGHDLEIPKAGTVIMLMSVANIANIIQKLLDQGWPANTPIAAIEHGTCYDQRTITGTLENFHQKTTDAKLRTPAVFIIGKVIKLHEKLNWFERKKNILVLGNHPQRYAYLGNIVHKRIIKCIGLKNTDKIDTILQEPDKIDWLVFTSINGVKYLFKRMFELNMDIRCFGSVKIAVIGQSTAKRIRELGICPDIIAAAESSKGLVKEFTKENMANKQVLFACAKIVSKELPQGLTRMGADVIQIPVYQTIDIDPGEINFDYIDHILFTSASTVRAFIKYYKHLPSTVTALALGEPTQRAAKEAGISAEIIQPKP